LSNYEAARQLAPDDPLVLGWLGALQIAAGRESEAIAPLRTNLANNPDDLVTLNNLAFALAETGTNLDEAMALANKALAESPSHPGIKDTLGWVYVKKGLNDSAIQIYNALVQKYPKEPAFHYHLGVALYQKGRMADAKAQLNIALSNNPPKDLARKVQVMMLKLS
jgi:predicted Zn-dependent protease